LGCTPTEYRKKHAQE